MGPKPLLWPVSVWLVLWGFHTALWRRPWPEGLGPGEAHIMGTPLRVLGRAPECQQPT